MGLYCVSIQLMYKKNDNETRASWEDYYQVLSKYKNEFGDIRVPVRTIYPKENGVKLGAWLKRQRMLLARVPESELSLIARHRYDALKKLDPNLFVRNLRAKKKGYTFKNPREGQSSFRLQSSLMWQSYFNKLIVYHAKRGGIPYDVVDCTDKSLVRWVRRQICINDNYLKNWIEKKDYTIWSSKDAMEWKNRRIRLMEAVNFDFQNEQSLEKSEKDDMLEEISRLSYLFLTKHKLSDEEFLESLENQIKLEGFKEKVLIRAHKRRLERYKKDADFIRYNPDSHELETFEVKISNSPNHIKNLWDEMNVEDIEHLAEV